MCPLSQARPSSKPANIVTTGIAREFVWAIARQVIVTPG
jgi:hypothetical protein